MSQAICPIRSDPCDDQWACGRRQLCIHATVAPIDLLFDGVKHCVHFVGFRDEEYWSAVKVWGLPDFYHRGWDRRAMRDVVPFWDTVVFAKGDPDRPSPYSYDDSNEDDDPAANERHAENRSGAQMASSI